MHTVTHCVNKGDRRNLFVVIELGISPLFLYDYIESKSYHNHSQCQIDSSEEITESVFIETPPCNYKIVPDHSMLFLA